MTDLAPALAGQGTIETVDYHTAGEPFRIVTAGVATANGDTVLERRTWAQGHLDEVRAFLVNEPRGHADMYGGFITPPDDGAADFGVLFFHKDGFSTACGHGTIALAAWAVDTGRIEPVDGVARLTLDVPSGRLRVEIAVDEQGRPGQARFWNVDAFVSARDLTIATDEGLVPVDVSFGGAFYASVAVDGGDLDPSAAYLDRLITLARQIKAELAGHASVEHTDARLSGLYGVIFHADVASDPLHQRNVTVFADGEVDRSPCGSGTSARLAVLADQHRLGVGEPFCNEGVAGGRFDGRIEAVADPADGVGPQLVATSVAGAAFRTGSATFTLDPRDPLGLGFQLR
ncbi:MAG: proline racemase family protein [Actinomycetota bacterium]